MSKIDTSDIDVIVVGAGNAATCAALSAVENGAKVLMLETTRAKLAERGIDVPMVELEVKGIPKILDAHGGSLDVASEPGQGATFFVRLPVTSQEN